MEVASRQGVTVERVELSNGIPLLHNQARANPSVVVRVLVRAAASRESAERQGLAAFVGRMLRQGTTSIAKDALAEELDGMGAGLSIDVGYAVASGSIKALSDDFARAVEILSDVMRQPTFPESELEHVRKQALTDLRELEDSTRLVAERAWRSLAYPSTHPYHRLTSATEVTLRSFRRSDLVDFHAAWYGPAQVSLVVVGDVSLATAREVAERAFGTWQGGKADPVAATLPGTSSPVSQIREETLAGKTQADVVYGLPTLDRKDPDYYALAFANHILGRMYFMGRFGEKVRDELGLAYYAYSELQGGYGRAPWTVRAGVNPRNLDRALDSIRTELRRFLADGSTETEHADAISSLVGSLPRQLETNEGVAGALSEIELYDLGLDYLDRYPAIIRALSRDEVTDAARRWLDPDAMVTAVAGPPNPT